MKIVFTDPLKTLPVAVIISVVTVATLLVVTVNVPEVAPAAMVMVVGTVTAEDVSDKLTLRCVVVAAAATGPFSVTVPVEEGLAKPPCTLDGSMTMEMMDGGTTVSVAVWVQLSAAAIDAVFCEATA